MTKNEVINYIESLKEKLKNINSEEKNYALKAFAEMSKKIDKIIKSKQKDQESENSSISSFEFLKEYINEENDGINNLNLMGEIDDLSKDD